MWTHKLGETDRLAWWGEKEKEKTDGEQERKREGTTVHSLHVFILSPPSIFIMLHTHTDTECRTFDTMQRSFRSSYKKKRVVVKSRARANGERMRVFELEGHLRLTSEPMLTKPNKKKGCHKQNALPRDLVFFFFSGVVEESVCNQSFF